MYTLILCCKRFVFPHLLIHTTLSRPRHSCLQHNRSSIHNKWCSNHWYFLFCVLNWAMSLHCMTLYYCVFCLYCSWCFNIIIQLSTHIESLFDSFIMNGHIQQTISTIRNPKNAPYKHRTRLLNNNFWKRTLIKYFYLLMVVQSCSVHKEENIGWGQCLFGACTVQKGRCLFGVCPMVLSRPRLFKRRRRTEQSIHSFKWIILY